MDLDYRKKRKQARKNLDLLPRDTICRKNVANLKEYPRGACGNHNLIQFGHSAGANGISALCCNDPLYWTGSCDPTSQTR